ncbi:MAG: exodeoxyribonuclease VII large subunit, partial [Anaeroplasmataceae bacterium]|nr:exodeoxyribonuclease VII large subunit [Anaeroplasmataceae bacterium]
MEERYLTVTALTKYIKYKFDHDHHLEEVLLEGEISNFKHNSRGHFYFTLKDENASISVTMFSSFARLVKFEPKDGMKVFVKGNVTVYEPSGTYQINIREMKSDGVGDLYLAFQKLKSELEKEGLFDPEHKQKLPLFPQCIGVVTSPTGAAIKDIIHTVGRRYPLTRIILYPAIVQGEDAKDNVVEQIELANEQGLCDVLIVGRGGGSIEDLWAFNERCVAMAIYNSRIPII